MSIFQLGIEESKVFLEAANLNPDNFILPISLDSDGMRLIAREKGVITNCELLITVG